MTLKVRRMKKYNQRRSKNVMKVYRQDLQQLENKIQTSVSAFITASKDGSSTKTHTLHEQAKNNLAKLGPEMQKVADEMGGVFPKRVNDFLRSIDKVLVTEQPIGSFQPWQVASQRLEDILLK